MFPDKLTKAGLEFRAVVNNYEHQWWYHLTLVMTSCIIPWYGGVNYIEVRWVNVSAVISWLDEGAPTGFTTVVGSAIVESTTYRGAYEPCWQTRCLDLGSSVTDFGAMLVS